MILEETHNRLISEGLSFEQITRLKQGLKDAKNGVPGIPAREAHTLLREKLLIKYA